MSMVTCRTCGEALPRNEARRLGGALDGWKHRDCPQPDLMKALEESLLPVRPAPAERTILLSLTREQAELVKELVGRRPASEFLSADIYHRLRGVLEGTPASDDTEATK